MLTKAYQPSIDGLRALAILSVIAFHAFPNVFSGGYVGVDVFFVISGYLITSIILKNTSNREFSFVDFYSKRIRRIFPAF
jgi:peptidoglycan/LPS O-acetylase OafA/YrhL